MPPLKTRRNLSRWGKGFPRGGLKKNKGICLASRARKALRRAVGVHHRRNGDRASYRTLIALGENHHRSDVVLKALATWKDAVDNSDPYLVFSGAIYTGQPPKKSCVLMFVFYLPVKIFWLGKLINGQARIVFSSTLLLLFQS